ncbi:MAG TPA: GNAT family N-acetyltransferase [Gaiella sp.]|uniref:GNAT family N-acetyltransferase n=1 Tax=Gaiella sp. TaxID=2663207 RepID=UPI002D8021A2|nr:GNAT family N-acetyltransferase [Gaiella sp.]HET9287921.1 GNAT family N-acetyltransferase [Gaiella sp.]
MADVVDVILRDGSTLRLRPPAREDAESILDFFRALSEQSLYMRFHGFPSLGPQVVEQVLDSDWAERGALLGSLVEDGSERVVALANYARLRDPTAAEAAFAVADAYQRRGVGTRLVEQLAERAARHGIERFVAEVLPDNRKMLGVFEALGFELTRELGGGELEITFPIARTERFEELLAERDHVAVTASLRPFFQPGSVAVIGASRRRGTIGGELFRNIIDADFTGSAFPVNRDGDSVAGVRGYRSIDEIPDPVDLAVLCVPAAGVLEAAEQALRRGVRALVVISAGFAEIGSEGIDRQERLLSLVRAHGARLIGPNCLGIAVAEPRLNATFASRSAEPGNIGFSSQSGALGLALLEAAVTRGLGLSAFVSIGNKADVSTNDLLEWWEEDPATEAILLYVESFGNPRRFGRIARRVARRKPLLALKSGTSASGQRAASSHTAALAGSDAAVDALFHQAGVIRAATLEELIDVAALLSSQTRLAGRSVGIMTNAGGLGILCADACEAAGLELPSLGDETVSALRSVLPAESSVANPVDMLGGATAQTYGAVLPQLLTDSHVAAVVVLFVPAVSATAEEVASAVADAAAQVDGDRPVLAVIMSSDGIPAALRGSRHVAAFAYPESAARALGRVADRAEWLRRPQGAVPALGGIDHARAEKIVAATLERSDDIWLDPATTRELLLAYGVPLVPERIATSVDEAVAAARELGFPAVVKTAAPGAHKTEAGGIALELADGDAVAAATERIGAPVIVQPMLMGGAELLAGVVQDPVFGPLVAFGPGGVFAELIGEAAFRIAPLTDVDAEELVFGGKAGRLVAGFRGAPAADGPALVDLVHRLARLGEDVPAVAELDLNPVLALPDRCVAVDARVRLRRPDAVVRAKSW